MTGAKVLTDAVGAARFNAQVATVPEQKAFSRLPIKVTVLPGVR